MQNKKKKQKKNVRGKLHGYLHRVSSRLKILVIEVLMAYNGTLSF